MQAYVYTYLFIVKMQLYDKLHNWTEKWKNDLEVYSIVKRDKT